MYAYDYFIYSIGFRLGRNSEISNFGGIRVPRSREIKVVDPVIKSQHTISPMKAIEPRSDVREARVILLAYPR